MIHQCGHNMRILSHTPWRLAAICLGYVLLSGCSKDDHNNLDHTAPDPLSAFTIINQFEALFPDANDVTSQGTNPPTPHFWRWTAGLHDRYILSIEFELLQDPHSEARRPFAPLRVDPSIQFSLVEVDTIEILRDGGRTIRFLSTQRINLGQWNQLVASDGDFSSIGIELKKSSPVSGFKERMND